jgi:hypothetical protein
VAKVILTLELEKRINKIFKSESVKIISLILSLEENPKKGKDLGSVGGVTVKEIKYNKFRFYFITDGYKVKFLSIGELNDLIIKFVRMSEKKDQQKTINEIKTILRKFGEEGF